MSTPFPPDRWPFEASWYPGNHPGGYYETDPSVRQTPTQPGTASFPFPGQTGTPVGEPTTPPQTLPYPYPPYTIPPGTFPPGAGQPAVPPQPTLPLIEQSYIENILRLNLGKKTTLYATFEGNPEWNAMTFTGTLEAAGRDHVIIEDEATTVRYLVPMVFVNYFTFEGPLNYSYPFDIPQPGTSAGTAAGTGSQPGRSGTGQQPG